MRKRRVLHLNRTILGFAVLGYSAFLVLMLIMDWYLIRDSQMEMMAAQQETLTDYVDRMQDSMDRIDRQLSEIYLQDEDFQALMRRQDPVMEYSRAYDLQQTLYWRMSVDESLSGFYIYYGGRQKVLYRVSAEAVSVFDTAEINEQLRDRLASGTGNKVWNSVTVGENSYLAVNFERENVAVVGIYSLLDAENVIRESIGRDIELVLIDGGAVLKNGALAEKLGLAEEASRYTNSFTDTIGRYQVYGHRIPNMEMWICAVYPMTFWGMLNAQQLFLLLLTIISVLAILLLIRYMNHEVMRPIRQLTDIMNTIRKGEASDVPLLDCRVYEMQEVNRTLGEMLKELREQKIRTYEETIQKDRARMQYLQLQLKPHFYLNGLKLLNALAMEQQTDQMQDFIMDLSRHIRYLLQNEREIVPLSMELDFVKNYVDMQKYLSNRPVHCEIEADSGAADCLVPTLIVQTFVENSVKYVRLGESGACLRIYVKVSRLSAEDGSFLDIVVRDNGHGYPEEILQEINGAILEGDVSVGINNIKRRCLFLYGDRVEYSFSNYEGALSELIIPERRSENEHIAG